MYYQELIERMWNFNQRIKLGSTAIAMYLYLLKLGNDANGYDVSLSDVDLSKILGITRKTVKQTKEKLKNLGLIQYKNKNGFACNYRLLVNYSLDISEFQDLQKTKSDENSSMPKFQKSKTSQELEHFQESSQKNIQQENLDHTKIIQDIKRNYPSLEEFMVFAKTLDGYKVSLNSAIESKFILWSQNGWKNNSDRPINNWKHSLKSSLPYLKDNTDKTEKYDKSLPSIKRPKSIFDN